MKLDPNEILERAGQIRGQLKRKIDLQNQHLCVSCPIESTQVKALCMAICEALNKEQNDTTETNH